MYYIYYFAYCSNLLKLEINAYKHFEGFSNDEEINWSKNHLFLLNKEQNCYDSHLSKM